MSSYKKLEQIAEAHNVDVQSGWEAGHPIIELWGRTEDLEKMKPPSGTTISSAVTSALSAQMARTFSTSIRTRESAGTSWATSHGARASRDPRALQLQRPPALRPLPVERGGDAGEPARHPHPCGDRGDAPQDPSRREDGDLLAEGIRRAGSVQPS